MISCIISCLLQAYKSSQVKKNRHLHVWILPRYNWMNEISDDIIDNIGIIKVMQDIEKIYEEYFETVNKYLFCLTHNNDISEELTQETFYKAVKKISSDTIIECYKKMV